MPELMKPTGSPFLDFEKIVFAQVDDEVLVPAPECRQEAATTVHPAIDRFRLIVGETSCIRKDKQLVLRQAACRHVCVVNEGVRDEEFVFEDIFPSTKIPLILICAQIIAVRRRT